MFGFCVMRGSKEGERLQSWSQPETNISNRALNIKFAQVEFFVRAYSNIVYSNVSLVEKFLPTNYQNILESLPI